MEQLNVTNQTHSQLENDVPEKGCPIVETNEATKLEPETEDGVESKEPDNHEVAVDKEVDDAKHDDAEIEEKQDEPEEKVDDPPSRKRQHDEVAAGTATEFDADSKTDESPSKKARTDDAEGVGENETNISA